MANIINLVQVPVQDSSGATVNLYNSGSRVRIIRLQPFTATSTTPEAPA